MPDSQYPVIRRILDTITLPTNRTVTQEAFDLFEQACDLVMMYRGSAEGLIQPLQMFLATDCLPYACAGIAKIVFAAASIPGGGVDADGHRNGTGWLLKAQEMATSRLEIDVIEFDMYVTANRVQGQRALLDKLKQRFGAATNFRLALAEMRYWSMVNKMTEMEEWGDRAFKLAQNNIQKIYILNVMADVYAKLPYRLQQALEIYSKIVNIDPSHPLVWHNMSQIFLTAKQFDDAGYCNDRALNLLDFEAAREVQARLIDEWKANRQADILDDMPPYWTVPPKRSESDAASAFKKFFGS